MRAHADFQTPRPLLDIVGHSGSGPANARPGPADARPGRGIFVDSMGWVPIPDGTNKGKYRTKGELLMGRDVPHEGDIRGRCLHPLFLNSQELKEYKQLNVEPFGAGAQ